MRRESNKNFFQPRARLLILLGDTLIKNENIALLELIKNSFDADSRKVKVRLELGQNKQNSRIDVIDDGEGMDINIIEDVWLEPGSDYKLQKFKNRKRTNKYKRLPIGEKGIGRFGVHKLGHKIEMVSRKSDSEEVVVRIDWNDFSKNKYLKDARFEVFERTPEYFLRSRTGTRITITDLRADWDKKMVRDLYRSVFNLNSPFKKRGNFFVEVEVSVPSLVEKLPVWEDIKKFSLWHVKCTLEGSRINEFNYEFIPWKSMYGVDGRSVTQKDDFVIKNADLIEKLKGGEEIEINLSKNYGTVEEPKSIGKIVFEAYIFDRARSTLNLFEQQGVTMLKNYLDEQGGISVYRDNVKINSYGEKGNDWLNLDMRRVNIPAKRISNNLILGVVDLELDKCTALIEKTNREGFIENDAFGDFTAALRYVLHKIEILRQSDKGIMRDKLEPNEKTEPVLYYLNELRSLVNQKVKDDSLKVQIIDHLVKIENDYDLINEILLVSAGAGLTLAVGVHEIQKVLAELNVIVKKENIPDNILRLVQHLDDLIENYSDLLRQSDKKKEDIKRLLQGALFNVDYRLRGHSIKIVSEYLNKQGTWEVNCSKRLLLGAIINIIDNSIYWLERKKRQLKKEGRSFKKKILIDIIHDKSNGLIEILIADNGLGFGMPIHQITKPFISDKPDGMGLGLHIVKEVMKVQDGVVCFPKEGEYLLPKEFDKGAQVVLKVKEG